jgi:hypothetical protein
VEEILQRTEGSLQQGTVDAASRAAQDVVDDKAFRYQRGIRVEGDAIETNTDSTEEEKQERRTRNQQNAARYYGARVAATYDQAQQRMEQVIEPAMNSAIRERNEQQQRRVDSLCRQYGLDPRQYHKMLDQVLQKDSDSLDDRFEELQGLFEDIVSAGVAAQMRASLMADYGPLASAYAGWIASGAIEALIHGICSPEDADTAIAEIQAIVADADAAIEQAELEALEQQQAAEEEQARQQQLSDMYRAFGDILGTRGVDTIIHGADTMDEAWKQLQEAAADILDALEAAEQEQQGAEPSEQRRRGQPIWMTVAAWMAGRSKEATTYCDDGRDNRGSLWEKGPDGQDIYVPGWSDVVSDTPARDASTAPTNNDDTSDSIFGRMLSGSGITDQPHTPLLLSDTGGRDPFMKQLEAAKQAREAEKIPVPRGRGRSSSERQQQTTTSDSSSQGSASADSSHSQRSSRPTSVYRSARLDDRVVQDVAYHRREDLEHAVYLDAISHELSDQDAAEQMKRELKRATETRAALRERQAYGESQLSQPDHEGRSTYEKLNQERIEADRARNARWQETAAAMANGVRQQVHQDQVDMARNLMEQGYSQQELILSGHFGLEHFP